MAEKRLAILPLIAGGTLQGVITFGWNNPNTTIPADLEVTLATIAVKQPSVWKECHCTKVSKKWR